MAKRKPERRGRLAAAVRRSDPPADVPIDDAALPPGGDMTEKPFDAPPGERPGRPSGSVSTLTLPTGAGGTFAWDLIGDKKAARLRKATRDPEFQRRFMPKPETAGDAPPTFDAGMCGVLYDTASVLMVGLMRARGFGDRAELMRFSDQDKAILVDPTARVLSKYVGEFKYQDEVTLALALFAVVTGKIALLRAAPAAPAPPTPAPPLPLFEAGAGEGRPS